MQKESQLFPAKPAVDPRIYAYTIDDEHHRGLLKVGETAKQSVQERVEQQLRTAAIKNYRIVLNEPAISDDGDRIRDGQLRQHLKKKGFENPTLEWMRCTVSDVKTALLELRTKQPLEATRDWNFPPRDEQTAAVQKTAEYFRSIWNEAGSQPPRFLWNAKMRFGKTFATYKLAQEVDAERVLVVTFKPAVEDAWEADLTRHVDFNGWKFLSGRQVNSEEGVDSTPAPFAYFASLQDLIGKDKFGNVKAKNSWLHRTKWDLVVFDEYHFGAWREASKELFEGEVGNDDLLETSSLIENFEHEIGELGQTEADFLPLKAKAYLYLSGTPFRALGSGEFIEEQVFNWTYKDEQLAKERFEKTHGNDIPSPYAALPQMRLMTYKVPDEILSVARMGELDEFDLNTFFQAEGEGEEAKFTHASEVQKWLDLIRGNLRHTQLDLLKLGSKRPPFPYSDARLLPYLQHSFWLLPNVAACFAMKNLLEARHNSYWHDYRVIAAAGAKAGIGVKALGPVRDAIGSGLGTKTITLSCGKLTTGVTVPQWSSILMLRNLDSPETYFQAAFRVQSSWVIDGSETNLTEEPVIIKPTCFVFDFAPTRALRQLGEYSQRLSPQASSPEKALEELLSFLPVLSFDGAQMTQKDASQVLEYAVSGTTATLLAKKWVSALLVNVDNKTLSKLLSDKKALNAVMSIEGFRSLPDNAIEVLVNKSDEISRVKKSSELTDSNRKQLTEEEKKQRSVRQQIRDNLIKFATRIPLFMYLTDYRENTLRDVVTKLEPGLFKKVTGLEIADFELLLSIGLFNSEHMDNAIYAFRRYEDASLQYSGITRHEFPRRIGLFDTVISEVPGSTDSQQ